MTDFIIDAHLDMAYNAVVLRRDLTRPLAEIRAAEVKRPPPGRPAGTALVSIPELLAGHVAVVGASLYVAPATRGWEAEAQVYHTPEEAETQAIAQLDEYRRLADEHARVTLLKDAASLDDVVNSQDTDRAQVGLFVVMEGAEPIREPDRLAWWIKRGLRGVGLTWSAGTRYAGGNAAPGPLTEAGRALLDAMADYNLLLDVSHLWVDAVYEVLDRYPGPIVATHANPRAFVDSPRLLSDDLIRRIAERGGVMGMIPFNRMLDPAWRTGDPRLPLNRYVAAIDHVCQVTGQAGAVGIGSDFDGGFGLESIPATLDSVADLGKIAPLLAERGYTDADIERILRGNWLGKMREVLGSF